jgi:Mg-chelatase subunit ChlD
MSSSIDPFTLGTAATMAIQIGLQPAASYVIRRGAVDAAADAAAEAAALLDELPVEPRSPAAAPPEAQPITLEITLTVETRGSEDTAQAVRGVVTLRAPVEAAAPRVAADLVFVLDVSGSMTGSKIDMVQRSLRWLASDACLTALDRVAIIAFDDVADVKMPLRFMNSDGKRGLETVANNLRPRGGTSIKAGLDKALSVLSARRFVNASTAVIFLSDGEDATARLACDPILMAIAAVASVRVVGLGIDHDAALLKHIADAAHGEYAFAAEALDVAPTIGSAVSAATSAVASRLKELTVVAHFPSAERVVLTKPELGTLCSDEVKHYCFASAVPPTRFEARLEYYEPGAAMPKFISAVKALPPGDGEYSANDTLILIELQELREATTAATAEVSRILQSATLDDAGLRCRGVLEAVVQRIEISAVASEPMAVALLADLTWMLQVCERGGNFGGGGGGVLAATISLHARHATMRATGTGAIGGGEALYATPSIARSTRDAIRGTLH